jgi:hypothetical protein
MAGSDESTIQGIGHRTHLWSRIRRLQGLSNNSSSETDAVKGKGAVYGDFINRKSRQVHHEEDDEEEE